MSSKRMRSLYCPITIAEVSANLKNMKSTYCLSLFVLLLGWSGWYNDIHAQGVKISENKNDLSTVATGAILELSSTTKGLLLPRVQDTNRVAAPTAGLLVYQLADRKVYFYNGTVWVNTAAGATTTTNPGTGGTTPNLAQVLTVGNNGNNKNIIGIDTLRSNALRIKENYPSADSFREADRLLMVNSKGEVTPVTASSFFEPKIYKKSTLIPTSVLNKAASPGDFSTTDLTLYYTYKAYGTNAANVTVTYRAAQPGDPLYYGNQGVSENNVEVTIPDGVEMVYLHFAISQKVLNWGVALVGPQDGGGEGSPGTRLHFVYQGKTSLPFNQQQTASSTYEYVDSDPAFLSDFYMPIMKAVFMRPSVSLLGSGSSAVNGMGYIDDHKLPLQRDPATGEVTSPNSATLGRSSQDAPNLTAPLVRFRLISSSGNRMIVGMSYLTYIMDGGTSAIRVAIFF